MIKVSSLNKSIEAKEILSDINLDVKKGCFFGVLGPNGSGKTSLLRCLAGVDRDYRGQIMLEQQDLKDLQSEPRSQKIAWAPTLFDVPFSFKVREVVMFGRHPNHRGYPSANDRKHCDQALDLLGIKHLAGSLITRISSGELRKVHIARVLASDAEILIFDEPIANLDISASLQLLLLFKKLAKQGKTIIASIHELSLAFRFADKCLILNKGRVVSIGKPSEALTDELMEDVFDVKTSRYFDRFERSYLVFHAKNDHKRQLPAPE